jgi:hypothetical protein
MGGAFKPNGEKRDAYVTGEKARGKETTRKTKTWWVNNQIDIGEIG